MAEREDREQGRLDEGRARVALAAVMLLCLVGLGVGWELTRVWLLSRTDPDYHSFCAVTEGMNCETVALSRWSVFLGAPNSTWAMAAYLYGIGLAALAWRGRGRGLLWGIAASMSLVSLWLLGVMHFAIGSLCILCLALDVVNWAVLAFAWVALRASGTSILGALREDLRWSWRHRAGGVALAVLGIGLLGGAWAFGQRLVQQVQGGDAPARSPVAGASCGESGALGNVIQSGITPEGSFWIGSGEPVLTIEEFTDYQCPHCRRAHLRVRQLLSSAGGRIRVIHRHLPLDNHCNPAIERPFHPRACELSLAAICAGRQGRFWEMNDLLFQQADEIRQREVPVRTLAERLALSLDEFDCCMGDPAAREVLDRDVAEANRLGLRGTPAFRIDGQVFYGKIPDERLKAAGIPPPPP